MLTKKKELYNRRRQRSEIDRILQKQRAFFAEGKTRDPFQKGCPKTARGFDPAHEKEVCQALTEDLGKSETEGYMCEVGLTLLEIRGLYWNVVPIAKQTCPGQHGEFSGKRIPQEPYGVTLVMSPELSVYAGDGAARRSNCGGNCCVVKPSACTCNFGCHCSDCKRMLPGRLCCGDRGRQENWELLEQRFDYIFFTGSVSVGKLVMEKAAKHLTPVSLELGGKSPCIVDHTAKLSLAAKRIVFGKFLNCGQTCVAPDYVLVERRVKDAFLKYLIYWTKKMYGENAFANPSYGRIVNRKHFDRISGLIEENKVVYGGRTKEETLQIEPTILFPVSEKDAVMQEEIFGPVLPILVGKYGRSAALCAESGKTARLLYFHFEQKDAQKICPLYVLWRRASMTP
ncbi:MAG: aldehyde dehydrogenase family protein [Gallintestinimicrobium sp.]